MTEQELEHLRDIYVGRQVQRGTNGAIAKVADVTEDGMVKITSPGNRSPRYWPLEEIEKVLA